MYGVILSFRDKLEPVEYAGFQTKKEAINFIKINITLNEKVVLAKIVYDPPTFYNRDMEEIEEVNYTLKDRVRYMYIVLGAGYEL